MDNLSISCINCWFSFGVFGEQQYASFQATVLTMSEFFLNCYQTSLKVISSVSFEVGGLMQLHVNCIQVKL